MQIDFNIENQRLNKLNESFIVENSQNYLECSFIFSDDWQSFKKLAYFQSTLDSVPKIVEIVDDKCIVPHESIKAPFLKVWVIGYKDEVKITTNFETLSIIRSGVDVGDETIEKPSKELWETLFNDFEFTYDKKEGNLKIAMIDVTGTRKEKNVIIFSDTDKYIVSVVYEETNKQFRFTFTDGTSIVCPFSVDLSDYPTNLQVDEKINESSGAVKEYVDNAIANLTATGVGGNGKYIKAISEANGIIFAVEETMDITPTNGSDKAITSGGVKKYVDETLENYAKKDGYYETFGYAREAGIAKNLQNDEGKLLDPDVTTSGGTVYADQPFTQRATAMTMKAYIDNELITVGSGYEQWRKEQAFSIVRNQVLKDNNLPNNQNWIGSSGTEFSKTFSNGELSLKTSLLGDYYVQQNLSLIEGHKYLYYFKAKSDDISDTSQELFFLFFGSFNPKSILKSELTSANVYKSFYGIITAVSGDIDYFRFMFGMNGKTNTFTNPILIDLTQWFASRPEIATALNGDAGVKWFLQNYPQALTLGYDEGTIVDTEDYDYETTGVNLWDEEWELGKINNSTGENVSSTTNIRPKNYIRVLPNTTIYIKDNYGGLAIQGYDNNKNFVGYLNAKHNETLSIPSNVEYIRFYCDGTTYNNDIQICQHFTETSVEQTYHKYEIFKDRVSWAFTSTGKGKSAGSVADTKDYVNKKNIEKVGQVDLGTLTYSYNLGAQTNIFRVGSNAISNIKKGTTNVVSVKYHYIKYADKNYSIWVTDYGGIYIQDNDFYDSSKTPEQMVASFKAALSGVILNYELATPVITDMEGDELNTNIPENDYGVERKVPVSGDMFSGSATTIFYQDNPLRQIYNNKSAIDNLQKGLSAETTTRSDTDTALQNAIGGTLRQCLCVKESLDFDNTDFVDLETITLDTSITSVNGLYRFTSTTLVGVAKGSSSNNTIAKCLCTKIKTNSIDNTYLCKTGIAISSSGSISIFVQGINNANDMKKYLKGQLLAYEKASE